MMTTLAASPALAECEPVANADAVLGPGARLFVGEVHGTHEMPRAFGALVCHASKKGAPVRVGLELPATEDALLAAYLASGGTPADRAALLRGPFWTREFQDGRSSVAMVQLIERIRLLKRGGADVDLATFDDTMTKNRDLAMAERAAAAIARAPKATWLLYAGNLHARKTSGRFPQTFMAAYLAKKGVPLTTLDTRYAAGSAWVCYGATAADCGPSPAGRGEPRPVGVTLAATPDGAYDGVLDVGAVSFAAPAALPMSPLQAAKGKSIDRQRAARATYDAKKYAECAPLYEALAKELRSSNDAYSAACCHALAGKVDAAFAALATALELGYVDHGDLARDTDFASLRSDARWAPLVTRATSKSAK